MAKVYLSSTLLDLKAERQAVTDWLIAAGHQPVHSYVGDSESVSASCLADIAGCEMYVVILGHRYGFVPGSDNPDHLSITQLEFRHAGELGIPRLALLRTSVPDIRLTDINDPTRNERVQAFRAEVADALRPAEFGDQAGLIAALSTGVQRALARQADRAAGPEPILPKVSGVAHAQPESSRTSTAPSRGEDQANGGWWSTVPGVLTGAAALVTAIGGLLALFVNHEKPPAPILATPPAVTAPIASPVATSSEESPGKDKNQEVKLGNVGAGANINIQQKQ